MNRKSGAFGWSRMSGKQGALTSDGILALVVGLLLVLTLAVVAIAVVMPLADHEVSPGIMAGFEIGLARWSVWGKLYAACSEEAGVAQAMEPDGAFVHSVAFTVPSAGGYAAAGPCSLSMSPAEAGAYVQGLA